MSEFTNKSLESDKMDIKTVRCEYCKKELSIEEAIKTTGIGWKGIHKIYYHGACQLPAMIRGVFICISYSFLIFIGIVVFLLLLGWN